jgi:3-methylcrotonyl-CoA carboxylase alpha subunit
MLESDDPWSRRDGWRLHGSALRRFDLAVRGRHHVVRLERRNDGAMRLSADDASWAFAVMSDGLEHHDLLLDGRRHRLTVYATGERFTVFGTDGMAVIDEFDPIAHAADATGDGGCLAAPMPGKVIALLARAGDVVKKGQALAVIEAMKMEHTLSAPRDGAVAELLHAVGDQVAEGSELLRLADA